MVKTSIAQIPSEGSKEGGGVGQTGPIDWSVLIAHLVQTKVTIIEAMLWIERPMSATELEKVSGGVPGLGSFSHHLKSLVDVGVLEVVEKRKARKSQSANKETFFYFVGHIKR